MRLSRQKLQLTGVHVEHTKYFLVHIEPQYAAKSRILVHGVPKMLSNPGFVVNSGVFVNTEPKHAVNSRIFVHEPKNAVKSRFFVHIFVQHEPKHAAKSRFFGIASGQDLAEDRQELWLEVWLLD